MNTQARILVVDDDAGHRAMLRTMLGSWGYAVTDVDDGEAAVSVVRETPFDAVLMDVRMARMDGIAALRGIMNYNPALPVVLMTAYSSVETAVEALRLGAYDYLTKPLDFEQLRVTLEHALEHSRLKVENRELRRQLASASAHTATGILGHSVCVRDMLDVISTVAPTEATVLITGESGTGKEMVARALHAGSQRAEKALVTVNCAALTETLLESELFGHERGAFTGAEKRREGRFVQAHGGTLFLDEIGEISIAVQAKLLRALQEGEVQRVGADTPVHVDVRILAATNRDLHEAVKERTFREDLYFRLNVISMHVPPLREREDDIPLLAAHFLQRFAERNRKHLKGFSPQAMDALLRYAWPGNIRELENAIERAVIMCVGDTVTERALPLALTNTLPDTLVNTQNSAYGTIFYEMEEIAEHTEVAGFAGLPLEALERRAILQTLREADDNKSEAARRLGITRATLHNKLKRYGIG